MTHYEQRLETDLQVIRSGVENLGRAVESALENAIAALLQRNVPLAYETILRDQAVNRLVKKLDRLCHEFVARHLPSAGHLRFISSVLRLTVELERVGDYAVTLCRETVQLDREPPPPVQRDLELLCREARRSLHESLEAFVTLNPELARGTHSMAAISSVIYDKAFAGLLEEGQSGSHPVRELFSLLLVYSRLARVCDQAKNICEEAVFAATGQTKEPRHFRILFVDRPGWGGALMAVAIGRKAYPEGVSFDAASLGGAAAAGHQLVEFMDSKGHSLDGIERLDLSSGASLQDYDILVTLGGVAPEELPPVPYHTVFQVWSLEEGPLPAEPGETWDKVYRELAFRLRELMEVLRGGA